MMYAMASHEAKNTVSLLQWRSRVRTRAEALERINRITGLHFEQLPESLIKDSEGLALAQDDAEELIYRALHLWAEQQQESEGSK